MPLPSAAASLKDIPSKYFLLQYSLTYDDNGFSRLASYVRFLTYGVALLSDFNYERGYGRKVMQNPSIIYGIVNISSGILFILMSIPLVAKKIPMNKFYGFRIPKSFTSDENWFKINSYGGRQLIFWSILLITIGILHLFFPVQAHQNETVNALRAVGPLVVCVAISIVKTIFFSREL